MEERGAQDSVLDVSRSNVLAALHGAACASRCDRLDLQVTLEELPKRSFVEIVQSVID